jgi:hypothetical protein
MITVYSYKSGSTPLRAFPGFHLAWLKGNDKGNEKANERSADRAPADPFYRCRNRQSSCLRLTD